MYVIILLLSFQLQIAFSEGKLHELKKGLIKPLEHTKENYTNDTVSC